MLVIALASGATYFISNRDSEMNLLEMKLASWRARFEALENDLVLLRQQSLNKIAATTNVSDKSCEKSESKQTTADLSKTVKPKVSKSMRTGEQNSSKVLDDKSLDGLLSNGELEKALDSVRSDLDPEKRIRLITALTKLKESSVLQNSKQYEESDPEYLRSRIDRSIRILEVNRVFERELGIGVSQFINLLDSSEVEDVSNN